MSSASDSAGTDTAIHASVAPSHRGILRRRTSPATPIRAAMATYRPAAVWIGTVIRRIAR